MSWDHREEVWFGISFFQYFSHHPHVPFWSVFLLHRRTTPVSFFSTCSPSWCWWWTCAVLEAWSMYTCVRAFQTPINTPNSTGLDYSTVRCCFMPSLDDSLAAHPSPHIIKVLYYKDLLSNPATFWWKVFCSELPEVCSFHSVLLFRIVPDLKSIFFRSFPLFFTLLLLTK